MQEQWFLFENEELLFARSSVEFEARMQKFDDVEAVSCLMSRFYSWEVRRRILYKGKLNRPLFSPNYYQMLLESKKSNKKH